MEGERIFTVHVVWFKRDLRLHDHTPLAAASAAGAVLPLYMVEPMLWRQPDAAARHWRQVRAALAELADDLRRLDLNLIIRTGEATEILSALHAARPIEGLWSHQETGNAWSFARDRQIAAWCRDHRVPWHESRQHGVVRGLKTRDGWARKWDRQMAAAAAPPPAGADGVTEVTGEALPKIPRGLVDEPDGDQLQAGGRAQALALMDSFLNDRGRAYHLEMSSPRTADVSCSRLSVHLATGALSMREVAQATWRRMAGLRDETGPEVTRWRRALSAFNGRLHWHCHFMQKLEDAPNLEIVNLHRGYDGLRDNDDAKRLAAWATGRTGLPFIDACMRSLIATGWINFRMRAMLTAFATQHLWLHWRAPGLHLARLFSDYEPGIHWSQSQMQSGTTGINTVRIYNPVKQSHDQDPDGEFIRAWVPELAALPGAAIHEPWRLTPLELADAQIRLGIDYPQPIVDHLAAARAARERIYAVRKTAEFRAEAAAVMDRHGSRKSGLASSARRRKPAKRDTQESFTF